MFLRPLKPLNKSAAIEVLLVVVILVVAACLRFWHLESLPSGFHGDEAVSGLEGQHILREGSIGPYSPLALGQPAGPLYLTALAMRCLGETAWAVRAVSAFVGVATVAVLYFMVRRHYVGDESQRRWVALVAAASLATFDWHLHFSRVGFPVIAWPLCNLLAVWAALEAVRRQQARWWCLSGALTGAGIYVYNAHPLCVLALGLWMLFYVAWRRGVAPPRRVAWLACFGAAALLVAIPMIRYARDPANDYFGHAHSISIFSAPSSKWLELNGMVPKAVFLFGRFVEFWSNLTWASRMDGGDGTGIVPVVPVLMFAVVLLGLALGWRAKRGPLVGMSLFFLLCLPLGPMLTLDGLDRRAFALAPFLSLLCAVGLVELSGWKPRVKWAYPILQGAVVALFGVITAFNLNDYFVRAMPNEDVKWTFAWELAEACRYFNTLPPDAHVYFYSDRWANDYETRRFLAPNVSIEDRSHEFGTSFSFASTPGAGKPYFVLLGTYRDQLPKLQKLYPHGRVHLGTLMADGKATFVAFEVDNQ